MSLSFVKPILKSSITVNTLAPLNAALINRRNFSHALPNQFFFNKKSSKVEVEKLSMTNWKIGTPQKIPSGKTITYEPKEIKNLLDLFLGTIPIPTSLITTVSSEGVANTAPFALCSCINSNPPIISLTVGKKPDGSVKDTQVNIDATNEFSVNIVNEDFLESSVSAAAPLPHNVSEFDKIGFTKNPSSVIKAPLVAQSPVSYECKVISRNPITDKNGKETTVIYNAEVVKIHINDEVYDNKTGNINYDKFKLLTTVNSFKFDRINSFIEVPKPAPSKQ